MKTILITGASKGIGAATALLAGKAGYRVAINYCKSRDEALKIAHRIQSEGGTAAVFQADVSIEAEVSVLFSNVQQEWGSLDVLVNNAGTLEHQARLENLSASRFLRVFESNALSTFLCCKEAVRRMAFRYGGKGGSIVNVSSLAARTGSPEEYIDYAAAKGAVDTLTIGLSKEVAKDGIRVNGVRPAFIHTGIHALGGEPDRIERLLPSIPLQRGGQPLEVAEAILWLASDAASYSTGTFIDVTGGR